MYRWGLVECLSIMKHCVQSPAQHKTDMVAHICDLSIQEEEAGGPRAQAIFSLGYVRPYLKSMYTWTDRNRDVRVCVCTTLYTDEGGVCVPQRCKNNGSLEQMNICVINFDF